jgi:Rieske Fe-S protein
VTEPSSREESLTRSTVVSRREYLRMLVIVSGGLVFGTGAVASGIFRRHGGGEGPAKRIAGDVGVGELVNFSYPGGDDPAIAMRLPDGELVAFSSVCTHLSCAVLWRKELNHLECPCHDGVFDPRTGQVLAGPPPRPLPKIKLQERADGVYATGTEP